MKKIAVIFWFILNFVNTTNAQIEFAFLVNMKDTLEKQVQFKDLDTETRNQLRREISYVKEYINYLNEISIIEKSLKDKQLKLFQKKDDYLLAFKKSNNCTMNSDECFEVVLVPQKNVKISCFTYITDYNDPNYKKSKNILKKLLTAIDKINKLDPKYKIGLVMVKKKLYENSLKKGNKTGQAMSIPLEIFSLLYIKDIDFISTMNKIQWNSEKISIHKENIDNNIKVNIQNEYNVFKLENSQIDSLTAWWKINVDDYIKEIQAKEDIEQDSIIFDLSINGYASPDGNIIHNDSLSKWRALAVYNLFTGLKTKTIHSFENQAPHIDISLKKFWFGCRDVPKGFIKEPNYKSLPEKPVDLRGKYLESLRCVVFNLNRIYSFPVIVISHN